MSSLWRPLANCLRRGRGGHLIDHIPEYKYAEIWDKSLQPQMF